MKRTFKQFLIEAPLGDFKRVGNWEKSSSFRDARDRKLISHPKYVENVAKKLGKSPYTWNLVFVNSPAANRHTEVGEVDLAWVESNLGNEVANEVRGALDSDAINVIYTNNKGAQRINMTPWILLHRFGHAVARKNAVRTYSVYREASNHLISQLSMIMDNYGAKDFPTSDEQMSYRMDGGSSSRKDQLMMKHFFQHVATFKSARDGKIRDWFEVLNELIAQYVITGEIKFNPAPRCFGTKTTGKYCAQDIEEVNEHLETLSRDMEYMIDDILNSAVNKIYVM